MNYLWEVIVMAYAQEIPRQSIRFLVAKNYSAYMEISNVFLNQQQLTDGYTVEVNPYYRFFDIFREIYGPEIKEFPKLRESLTNLVFHLLAENDVLSGMTKEEYYKKLLYQDLKQKAFGETAAEAICFLNQQEREIVLSGLLRQYQTGSSLDIFNDMIQELIPNNIIYRSNENFYEILVYIGAKKEKSITCKMDFLIKMFVDLPYHVDIYYQHHFGIIGVDTTMKIDQIALC